MFRFVLSLAAATSCLHATCQAPKVVKQPGDAATLLARTKKLYDTPFQAGLVRFSCGIDFDFTSYLTSNFGAAVQTGGPVAQLLQPIRYRVEVDHSGATVTALQKLPDFSKVPQAAQLEASNRSLLAVGLNNWIPYAYAEVLPTGSTSYQFVKTVTGYDLSMQGEGLNGKLALDDELRLRSGIMDTTQHIEITTHFVNAPHGLVLAASSTDTNHAGVARFTYTYQNVDGFEIPEQVGVSSDANKVTMTYKLTACKVEHGIVLQVAPPATP